ncbi:uncharacterized protein LOC129599450 [Paramacrobiotus metropolitanus]|uniref:uncharacterized protein LOC129599450 n=1 Tax=Paramacrobiotus metropolitanus TaxID=2943436 RepID=UPI002446076D|nr:uncharacterized protein LOC129599450 [Paramacrobiotus metropolitanus]
MGNNSSYVSVANAYSKNIYVQVLGIPADLPDGADAGAHKNGFTKIAPGTFLTFRPKTESGKVYISVITEDNKWVCKNLEGDKEEGLIISPEGEAFTAQPGNVWVDTAGKRHQSSTVW